MPIQQFAKEQEGEYPFSKIKLLIEEESDDLTLSKKLDRYRTEGIKLTFPLEEGKNALQLLLEKRDISLELMHSMLLLQNGMVFTRNNHGETVFHTAAKFNREQTFKILLTAHGLDAEILDAVDQAGKTALEVWLEQRDFSQELFDFTMAVNSAMVFKDISRRRLFLHTAAKEGREEAVKCIVANFKLTKKYANNSASSKTLLDSIDENGRTTLQVAYDHGHYKVCAILLNAKCSAVIKDEKCFWRLLLEQENWEAVKTISQYLDEAIMPNYLAWHLSDAQSETQSATDTLKLSHRQNSAAKISNASPFFSEKQEKVPPAELADKVQATKCSCTIL